MIVSSKMEQFMNQCWRGTEKCHEKYRGRNKMKPYKAVLYDIDGTILNTLNMNLYPLIQIIKEEKNENWSFDEVLKFAAYPGMRVMEELNIREKEAVYARWVKYVNEYDDGAELYEGMGDVLEGIHLAGMIQAIVSSKTREQYEIDIISKGIDRYMAEAVLADDTKKHKPDPDPLLTCIRRLKLSADEVIYIGDAAPDYEASRNAGIDFGYAKWGSVSDSGIICPQYVFETPKELLRLIRKEKATV